MRQERRDLELVLSFLALVASTDAALALAESGVCKPQKNLPELVRAGDERKQATTRSADCSCPARQGAAPLRLAASAARVTHARGIVTRMGREGCSAISRQSGRLGERQPGPCSADAPDMDQMRHALC